MALHGLVPIGVLQALHIGISQRDAARMCAMGTAAYECMTNKEEPGRRGVACCML